MTTLEVPKKFHEKKSSHYQILYLLKKHGPMTCWDLLDRIKAKGVERQYGTIQKALHKLRDMDMVGVVNYVEIDKRMKRRGSRWQYRNGRYGYYTYGSLGAKTGTKEDVELWALVNNAST